VPSKIASDLEGFRASQLYENQQERVDKADSSVRRFEETECLDIEM
jgi:hypothetical protein